MRIAVSILLGVAFAQGQPGSKRMPDGKLWTTRNLNVAVTPSYCYDGEARNCRQYGRLYTWESAQKACQVLGKGWRMPTDGEWRQLANAQLEAHGFYWTATESESESESGAAGAWYYNFGKGGLALHRQSDGEKPRVFSVRCVLQ